MPALLNFARKNSSNILEPFGKTDVLLLYALAAEKLEKYLANREIASRIWMTKGIPYLLKRGSQLEPLTAGELAEATTEEFLKMRAENDLKSAEADITKLQKKVWQYFFPRKLADFFYATNGESLGKSIDRIFFDLDRGERITASHAQEATKIFVDMVREDSGLKNLIGETEPFICWTGNSFHVMLFMDKAMPSSFYTKNFQYSKNEPEANFTGKWARQLREQVKFKVIGGHEKAPDFLTIDPSQTPSGKLCRAPLGALHMKSPKEIDGISVPLTRAMLNDKKLAGKLANLKPKDIVKNLDELAARLPKKFK